jgi:hypothetical protein
MPTPNDASANDGAGTGLGRGDLWLLGDTRERLRDLDAGSVQTCVTSPPYWGLRDYERGAMTQANRMPQPGLKPKDLVGIPWRVAFALQADGWYLRSDVVWHKPNPMPESVTDRPTKAHEYVFLLTKSERYHYDADAIREPDSGEPAGNGFAGRQGGSDRVGPLTGGAGTVEPWQPGKGRNRRTVWTIPTQPFAEAHFATMPPGRTRRRRGPRPVRRRGDHRARRSSQRPALRSHRVEPRLPRHRP